jgi:L-serine deaminase
MRESSMARKKDLYERFARLFDYMGSSVDPGIDQSTLSKLGIDATSVDLQEETATGGKCFRPMS